MAPSESEYRSQTRYFQAPCPERRKGCSGASSVAFRSLVRAHSWVGQRNPSQGAGDSPPLRPSSPREDRWPSPALRRGGGGCRAIQICDPLSQPALYPERWEFETALDELESHQRSPRVALRSKMPDGVIQEAYGYLCVHYQSVGSCIPLPSVRALSRPAELQTHSRITRRTTASHPGFPPEVLDDAHSQATAELFELLPVRRRRTNARVVKAPQAGSENGREHKCQPQIAPSAISVG